MSAPRILVTGGAGFIGSHTCKLLSRVGFNPVVYDNLTTGYAAAVKWGPMVVGDVLDVTSLSAAITKYEPCAVIHFAASAYVGESVDNPAKYYRNNVTGMIALMEACVNKRVRQIVLSSSCATYGVPAFLPIVESAAQRPINPYGRTKLMVEEILRDHAKVYDLRYAILRYFNACGADPDGEIGERHDPETHLIPRALLAASGRIPQLTIFGNDYSTCDGTCIRDYIHVTDLARAHVMALRNLTADNENLTVNLGSGCGTSVNEILQEIRRVTGRSVPTRVMPRRPGDPPILVADPTFAASRLGFKTEHSDLSTIIKTAMPFFGFENRWRHVGHAA